MKVAVFGCLHGMLNEMYKAIDNHEKTNNITIDIVLVCGDCQTLRHADDLRCLSVPDKYKKLGDFHEYYSGKKKIPKLTICIGGNHEASNYLMTLPYGGWLCDNFYYLGYAGVIRYKGLRIAGLSGIYNYFNHKKGRFERMPLERESIKSVYHTRQLDVFRLQLLSKNSEQKSPIDVFLSHDWPARIYDYGNREQLLRFKPAFKQDMTSKEGLGNPMTQPLIQQLKPRRWFAAHLHCKFYAKVKHDKTDLRCTEFLSLNKIENRRNYMDILDLEPSNNKDNNITDDNIYYDEEWLTILRKTKNLESNSRDIVFCPSIENDMAKPYFPSDEEVQETLKLMIDTGGLKIHKNFAMTEPVIYNRPNGVQPSFDHERKRFYPNPQTIELQKRLKLIDNQTSTTSNIQIKKESPPIDIKLEETTDVKKVEIVELDDDGCLPFHIDKKRRQD